MTVTANDIISPALEKIKVKDPLQSIDATDAATGIRELNDLMLSLADHNGIKLQYTIVSDIADEITTPDWSHGMMRWALAIVLAPEYGKAISPAMSAVADKYIEGVRRRCVKIGKAQLPGGLPTGQGNSAYGYNYGTASNFFHDEGIDDLRDELGAALDDENGNPLENDVLESL